MTLSALKSDQANRVIFLDKIRYTMVIGVLVLHAACAYTNLVPGWGVPETARHPFFDIVLLTFDIFLMPVLFFVAGYFTFPSLEKHGSGKFFISKLKRLGGGLTVAGLFYIPILTYLVRLPNMEVPVGFFKDWQNQLTTIFDLQWVHYTTQQVVDTHAGDFAQRHLWFISLLLIFFLLSALWFKLFHPLSKQDSDAQPAQSRSILISLTITAFFGITGMTLVQFVSPDWGWGKIGGLILLQPTRLSIYIAFFVLGLFAYACHWFEARSFPGNPWIWAGVSIVFTILVLAVLKKIGPQSAPIPLGQAIFHSAARTICALAFLCFFLSSGLRWWQQTTKLWHNLNPFSYEIYLIHLPLTIMFQFMLMDLAIPAIIKFIVVAIASIVVSWGLGKYIVKPYPFLATGLLLGVFSLVCIIW